MLDFVHLVRSRTKRKLVLVLPVSGIKRGGLRLSGTKSREMRDCPRPSDTWNQVSGTSSFRYVVMRKESMSLSS